MSPRSLVGKSILVTGASSGIGKATAKLLAANGARLIVAARSFDKLQSLAQEIAAFPVACDVTSLDSVKKMVEAALRHSGKIDALFANAGIYLSGDVAEGLPTDWSQLIDVNVKGERRDEFRTCSVTSYVGTGKRGYSCLQFDLRSPGDSLGTRV
jgi:ribitol 2-dehydrogenase